MMTDLVRIIILISFLFICTVTDFRTKKISVAVCIAYTIVGLILKIVLGQYEFIASALPCLVLGLVSKLSNECVGYGDVMVLLVMSLYMDVYEIMCVILTAFFIAAIYSAIVVVFYRKKGSTTIPFVPFILMTVLLTI